MFGICQGVLKNRDDRPRTNGESWRNIFVFLVNICHVLFDIKVGINLPLLICIVELEKSVQRIYMILSGIFRIKKYSPYVFL